MKISIIVPAYNAEHTIENTVKKMLSQHKDINVEILLIENGSIDKTYDVCKNLEIKYKQVITIHSEKKGPSAARNVGLDRATGEIIGFCDADDYFVEGTLERILELFTQMPDISMIIGSITAVKKESLSFLKRKTLKNTLVENSESLIPRFLCDARMMGSVCNKFYRRELLNSIRFDEKLFFCEDTYFNINVVKNNKNFKTQIIEQNVYQYVKTGESATRVTKKIFDGKDLKYIVTMNKIKSDFNLDSKAVNAIKKAKYVLAVDNYYIDGISAEQKAELSKIIKKNYDVFKRDFCEYTTARYFKFVILGKIILANYKG